MTHDERISSYIDNELSSEQEQEFLISLAASDGLRKSFRSELVLKNMLHRDETATNPPRKLRAAIFATIGLGIAGISSDKATAAHPASTMPAHGLMKSLFATKINTLITAASLSISALAGYGVHSLTNPASVSDRAAVHHVAHASKTVQPVTTQDLKEVAPAPATVAASVNHASGVTHRRHFDRNSSAALPKDTVNGAVGSGTMTMQPPNINRH